MTTLSGMAVIDRFFTCKGVERVITCDGGRLYRVSG